MTNSTESNPKKNKTTQPGARRLRWRALTRRKYSRQRIGFVSGSDQLRVDVEGKIGLGRHRSTAEAIGSLRQAYSNAEQIAEVSHETARLLEILTQRQLSSSLSSAFHPHHSLNQFKLLSGQIETGNKQITTTLERLQNQIASLQKEIVTKDDLLKQQESIVFEQKLISKNIQEKLEVLRDLQITNVAHRRLSKYSGAFLAFFIISFLADTILSVVIVTPFWNNIGLLFSFGFWLLSLGLAYSWKKSLGK